MQKLQISAEDVARRGDDIYERMISAQVEPTQRGKVVAIDVDTSVFVVDDNACAAARRLAIQAPDAVTWFVRVGDRTFHRLGLIHRLLSRAARLCAGN
jgi:hypothetical protein